MAGTSSGQVLTSYAKKLRRLRDETQSAGVAAEDALAQVEDRERNRVARSATADAELREKYTALRGTT